MMKLKVICTLLIVTMACSVAVAQSNLKAGDSITVAIAPEYNKVGNLHRFFLGESYRKLWATPVKIRIVDLQKEKGGFKVVKLGGGMQTRSLRLVDPSGKEWALRTVQKYPEQGLPASLKATIAKDIVQDQVSTNHPFAALIVPQLADALGLAYATPELVYVLDDAALGEYRKDFANAAYLLEPRSPFEEDTDNTDKVQRKIQEDNDTHADQKLVLRARLLDFVLGDWDRHEDNWRWLEKKDKEKGETTYIPVPRDRDKVFYKTSGVFPWVLNHQWLKTYLQPYSDNIRDVDHWSFNERYFDRYFLNELDEADWKETVKYVQTKLTPEVVNRAFRQMPDTIFRINGPELVKNFLSRKDKLDSLALHYYRFLSTNVDIPASDKKEYFELENKSNGSVGVKIYNINKEGKKGRKVFERTFNSSITKEIRLYGMAGEDLFDVKGNFSSPIKIRTIGGADPDAFQIADDVQNKPYIYDRSDEPNTFPSRKLARLRLDRDTSVNTFDKKSFLYDRKGILFSLNYNIDQGLQLGLGYVIEKQGFRKTPYASKHEFWANYSTGRQSFILDYLGDFKKAVGKNDLIVHANLLGPNNLSNFFGVGNDTKYLDAEELFGDDIREEGISYYRNRYDYLNADVRLSRKISKNLKVEGGIIGSFYTSKFSGNEEHFFNDYDLANPSEQIFSSKYYGGLIADLTYDTRNNINIPTKGIYWKTTLIGQHRLDKTSDKYGSVSSELRFFINPGKSGLVIANRVGAGTVIGAPAFFQMMQIGGVNSLRGFNSKRFTGTTMLYHNLDLRLKLFNFTSYLVPGTIGVIGFNDFGRVWVKGEKSGTFHQGYGGGLYVMPGQVILLQAAVGFSKEATMPYISIGFSF
ncbi:MAG: BamA/TamA family outer membrane protein [Bacteroidota bacterium]